MQIDNEWKVFLKKAKLTKQLMMKKWGEVIDPCSAHAEKFYKAHQEHGLTGDLLIDYVQVLPRHGLEGTGDEEEAKRILRINEEIKWHRERIAELENCS